MKRYIAVGSLMLTSLVAGSLGLHTGFAREANGVLRSHPRIFLGPSEIARLKDEVKSNSPSWTAVRAACDNFLTGAVEWPDGNNYPDSNSIGEGYQGSGYLAPLMELGLCYRLTPPGAKRSAYAAKGQEVLDKMSAPAGSAHAVDPLRDDGYGIRFYVVGMAIGFDWFYPALGSGLKSRLVTAMHRWINAFKIGGFENDFPMGNYFAGFYDATALATLASQGSDPAASWSSWRSTIQNKMVQPYYTANMSGGGWAEGWNYGPIGLVNMSWPVLAAQSAGAGDLVHAAGHPYVFPENSPKFLLYFTWPDLLTQEDSDFSYDSDNPTPTHTWLVAFESYLLASLKSPFAPYFQSYADAVRKVQAPDDEGSDWEIVYNLLFWNPGARTKPYADLPLSYVAHGVEMAATRSSWKPSAVWSEFKAGPYTAYPENGEELPDEGSLAIVNGSKPFLVNAWSALVRNTPGTNDGSALWNQAYDDVLGDNSPRDLFNVFYLSSPSPSGQGSHLRSDGARTRIDRFQDAGRFVDMRGIRLQDDYPRQDGEARGVASWTREIVYVRPRAFVVFDRTSVTAAAGGERMDFHFRGALIGKGVGRYDVGSGGSYSGTVTSVLPADAQDSIVDVFNAHKVYRLEVAPTPETRDTGWLTVLDAAHASSSAAAIVKLTTSSGAMGVSIAGEGVRVAVVQAVGKSFYSIPGSAKTDNIVVGLTPNTRYRVRVTPAPGTESVTITPSTTGIRSNGAGVLTFSTP